MKAQGRPNRGEMGYALLTAVGLAVVYLVAMSWHTLIQVGRSFIQGI